MTHDTPGDDESERRWCEDCQLAVEPAASEDGLVCPACESELSSVGRR